MVRRAYTRVIKRAPRKRWASHIESFILSSSSGDGTGSSAGAAIGTWKQLPINTADATYPTPSIIKCGRFKLSYEYNLDLSPTATPKNPANYMAQAVLIYVPQGWNIATSGSIYEQAVQRAQIIENLMYNHPEWILARRQVAIPQVNTSAQSSWFYGDIEQMSSKLKRNLNSGDFIMFAFFCKCINDHYVTAPFGINVNGVCEYKTCSN